MAALPAGDQLVNQSTPTSFGWSDILIEQLAISRDEYRLFTDPALQLGDLFGLPEASALADLQAMSLQDLSRRLGVSYDDLTAIVATRFINPNAALIPRLQQLDAPFATLQALHDTLNTPQSIAASFISALPAGLDATQYGGTSPADYQAVVDWVTGPAVYPLIMDIITISEPGGTTGDCSGASFQLRYSNPDNTANLLSGTDYLKLIRFIRLWRKLGPLLGDISDAASIQHTDDVIAALYPAADVPADTSDAAQDAANRPLLDAGFQALLMRLGFLFRVMSQLSLTGDMLDQLLACWAPIGTAGPGSLYQAMFLTPTLLQQDPGAQTATVNPTVNVGDVLHTAINLPSDQPGQVAYTVAPGDTAAAAAAAIAAALNAATTPDPASGLPLNARFHATSAGGVITIQAGFTLACSVSAGASETAAAAAASPLSQTVTIAGTVTAGDTLTATIDGVPVSLHRRGRGHPGHHRGRPGCLDQQHDGPGSVLRPPAEQPGRRVQRRRRGHHPHGERGRALHPGLLPHPGPRRHLRRRAARARRADGDGQRRGRPGRHPGHDHQLGRGPVHGHRGRYRRGHARGQHRRGDQRRRPAGSRPPSFRWAAWSRPPARRA